MQRRAVVSLLLLSSLTFLLGLGRQAITDSDEAFYAEASREMVESNDWLTPHFNYEERWQKPILYYWFTAAAFAGTDVTEFMATAFTNRKIPLTVSRPMIRPAATLQHGMTGVFGPVTSPSATVKFTTNALRRVARVLMMPSKTMTACI